jgi:isopentenyl diphosphate isomerase/L-lactate dehydrogenase-like FMN-dependent dehydrogenase
LEHAYNIADPREIGAEDAIRALENGADGIFVSNHGGRQLRDYP